MAGGLMTVELDRVVEQVLAGQTEAYREIIRLHERDVWAIAAAALQDRDATADLVQEVFVDAYVHLNRYERGRDFGVWLRSVARNLVREELRRRSRETRRLKIYRDHLAERYQDPSGAERHRALLTDAHRTCRRELPDHSREVLELRYLHSLTVPQIASKVGRSIEAVNQLLYRVRSILRECIAKKMVHA
jgi:RNA polymerase sigma-70 factor, ECF subfamily